MDEGYEHRTQPRPMERGETEWLALAWVALGWVAAPLIAVLAMWWLQ